LPLPRSIESLAKPSDSELLLYLAIAKRAADDNELEKEEGTERGRFSELTRTLRDETNGLDEYEVTLGRKNVRILSEAEISSGDFALPVARILRSRNGDFRYDPDFVPCSLKVSASDSLMLLIKRVLDMVGEKSEAIGRQTPGSIHSSGVPLPQDMVNHLFLHALHGNLPVLRHLLQTRHAHPAECFQELSRLAGALTTFSLDSDPRMLPNYDHVDPGPGFRALATQIIRHLEIISPTNSVQLDFAQAGPYLHSAPVTDERCLRRSRWILGVRSSLGESEQLRLVPQLVKVCSARVVPELVKRALPGMALTHLPVAPASLRTAIDMQYYSIDISGPCWQHILQTKSVGIYIPGEITDPDFTLTVLLERNA
jgi:type VI secretion system protein ImpJ